MVVKTRRLKTLDPRSPAPSASRPDRKSTRLNSSHANISYAVFCLKKKKQIEQLHSQVAQHIVAELAAQVSQIERHIAFKDPHDALHVPKSSLEHNSSEL